MDSSIRNRRDNSSSTGNSNENKRSSNKLIDEPIDDVLETENNDANPSQNVVVNTKQKLVNIAPLNIPLRRRLETFGIIWHTIAIPVFITLFLMIVSRGWVAWLLIILPYMIWWYGFDLHTPMNGKAVYRSRNWVKNLIVWEWFVDYFPIRVHKACEYPPTYTMVKTTVPNEKVVEDEEDLVNELSLTLIDKIFQYLGLGKRLNRSHDGFKKISNGPRYIFGYHPHGVISMGVMGFFATNIIRNEPFEPPLKFLKFLFHDPLQFKPLLPNIGNIFPLTLTEQFTLPFYRDYLLALGLTSASATNIRSLIKNGDNSVCIVVGGAQESLLNSGVTNNPVVSKHFKKPIDSGNTQKEIKLVLNKRKGFVKLAIELGNINLVPIFGFGEADIYNITSPKAGSLGDMFQKWMKKTFNFTIPFFSARGVFIYDFGFLPYRNPINICMGKPIYVPPNLVDQAHNSEGNSNDKLPATVPLDILDHYHKLYVEGLKEVFEENKAKYGYDNVILNIVE